MKLQLDGVSKGANARILTETTVEVSSGEAILVVAETEQRPTVLGLIATGRMKPDTGHVLLDGSPKRARALRAVSALVDAPDVSDPDANVLTVGVVAEELMFAGLPSHPIAARRWLDVHGASDLALAPIGTVEPSRRIRMLCELAAERPGVHLIVLVSPDRHGGRPHAWWQVAQDLAARGLAVLVVAGRASALALAAQDETLSEAPSTTTAPSHEDPDTIDPGMDPDAVEPATVEPEAISDTTALPDPAAEAAETEPNPTSDPDTITEPSATPAASDAQTPASDEPLDTDND